MSCFQTTSVVNNETDARPRAQFDDINKIASPGCNNFLKRDRRSPAWVRTYSAGKILFIAVLVDEECIWTGKTRTSKEAAVDGLASDSVQTVR